MTIPNFITIGRMLAVPVLAWALIHGFWTLALVSFVLAGLSDAVDGAIARHYDMRSRLGTFLDPLADKALLTTVFIGLGILGRLPDWITVAIVSRDLLIVAAVLLSYVMGRPVTVRPIPVSKATTLAQILLAGVALAEPASGIDLPWLTDILIAVAALLTGMSAAAYLVDWLRHMAPPETGRMQSERPLGEEGDPE